MVTLLLSCAQHYMYTLHENKIFKKVLKLEQRVAEADEAMAALRQAPSDEGRQQAAKAALVAVQTLRFGDSGDGSKLDDRIHECAVELTRLAARAHWAAQHTPDGSELWDHGVELAARGASAERQQGGGLLLEWQGWFEPERGGSQLTARDSILDAVGLRIWEIALRQEKNCVTAMPPPPALLKWLVAQPLAATPPSLLGITFDEHYQEDETETPLIVGTYAQLQAAVGEREAAQGPAWEDLSKGSRVAARLLRFGQRSWNAFPRRVLEPWNALSEEECAAALTLGYSPASWDAALAPAPPQPPPLDVSAAAKRCADAYVRHAEACEQKVRDVRGHPIPNREEEPNNASQDRELRELTDVVATRDAEVPWKEIPRERAWTWYAIADVSPH